MAGISPAIALLHILDSPYDDYELTQFIRKEDASGLLCHNQPRNSMALTTRSMATI